MERCIGQRPLLKMLYKQNGGEFSYNNQENN